MHKKNFIVALLIPCIAVAAIFLFFHFSYDEYIREEINRVLPDPFIDNISRIIGRDGVVDRDGVLTIAGIIEETNRHRNLHGESSLREDSTLNQIAMMKLDNMFKDQYFDHVSPDGVAVSDFADQVSYDFLLLGDNLARGNYHDDRDLVTDWMNSPGHRRNILESRYEKIGVAAKRGVYRDREQWFAVQVFAMPVSACPEPDANLLRDINRLEGEIEMLSLRRDDIDIAIKNSPVGSSEYTRNIERYNDVLAEYNKLVNTLNAKVESYNSQLEERDRCINE